MKLNPSDPLSACASPAIEPDHQRAAEGPIHTAKHALTLLPGMEAMLTSIARDVDAARSRVSVETYVYKGDKLGQSFADALARAAARGVPTRLLYDPLGSQETDPAFFEELRARGIETRAYRPPINVLRGKASLWPRDHSRVIVVDGYAYTGGAAWSEDWLPAARGGEGWHDVCLRAEGPVVEDFWMLFEQRWREASGEIATPSDFSTDRKYPDLELMGDSPEGRARVYNRFREVVQRAKHRVWIENAYFFPPYGLLGDLYDAAARGVDVQIIVPGRTDLPSIQRAARAEMPQWLAGGMRLWEYGLCVLHAKIAVVDDDFCTVGTFNINPTSLGFVNEVCLFVRDTGFVRRVADLFLSDRELSTAITQGDLAALPLKDRVINQLANDALSIVDHLVDRSS